MIITDKNIGIKMLSISKRFVICAFLFSLVVYNIATAEPVHINGKAKWTVMFYMDADNNLEPASLFTMSELEKVGSSEDVNIIVQWDRSRANSTPSERGEWDGSKRFLVLEGENRSQELEYLGEVDMGNMESLTEFINWTREKYPAENYAVVMWDHGSGWMGHTKDDTSNHPATLNSLADALKKAGFGEDEKLNLIVFDECLMGQIDIASAIAPYAKAMVASEDVIPALGINWVEPLSSLVKSSDMDEEQLSRIIVDNYKIYYEDKYPNPFVTLSAYDLEKMPHVIDATKNLSLVLRERTALMWPKIGRIISYSEGFAKSPDPVEELSYSYNDLLDFAYMIGGEIPDRDVAKAANELGEAFESASLAEYHGKEHPFARGLSAYFPMSEEIYRKDYPNESSFAAETGWNNFLQDYIDKTSIGDTAPDLKIHSVSPQPSNMTSVAKISYRATGKNLIHLYRYIGEKVGDDVVIQNGHEWVTIYDNDTSSHKHPKLFADLPDINEFESLWFPMTDVLTDGQESILAPTFQFGVNDDYFAVIGYYLKKGEKNPFLAGLIFDYRTGSLISAKTLQEPLSEFVPQPGDIFTPRHDVYDAQENKISRHKLGKAITFGDCGVWLDSCPLPDGLYKIGVHVVDLSGNEDFKWATVNVSGQPAPNRDLSGRDLLGKWVGYNPSYENTTFNFEFEEERLSRDDMKSQFGLDIPSCNVWYRCDAMIDTTGKPEKHPLAAYWIRHEHGWPLLTLLLLPEGRSEPISMAFLADVQQNKLYLMDLYEGGKYTLTKELASGPKVDVALIGRWGDKAEGIEFERDGTYTRNVLWITDTGSFNTSSGALYLTSKGSTRRFSYTVSGSTLQITDEKGSTSRYTK